MRQTHGGDTGLIGSVSLAMPSFYDLLLDIPTMPKILQSNPDTDKTVTRVVGYDLIRHVMRVTDMRIDDTAIFYPDTENKTYQPGSSIGDDSPENQLKPDTFDQVSVEVNEDQDVTFMNSTNVFTPENLYTFYDPALGITIRPSYTVMNLNVAFQYRTRDKNSAYKWRDLIRQKISAHLQTYLHTLTYSYTIDNRMWIILEALWQYRERVAGYGETFDQYLAKYLTPAATVMVGVDGKNGVRTIRETQGRLEGWFEFEGQPDHGGRDGRGDTWTMSFNYHLQYSKPTTTLMEYPIIVHNQLIDQRLRPEHRLELPEDTKQKYPLSLQSARQFEQDTWQVELLRRNGPCIPAFDEFVPAMDYEPNCYPMMQVAVLLDTAADPKFMMSFKGVIDTYVIDEDVLAWMVVEAPYMTTSYASVFQLSLFKGNTHYSDNQLTVDQDLNVFLKNDPDLRQPHRLILYLNRDIGRLALSARRRAQKHCRAFTKVMKVLFTQFANVDDSMCLAGDLIAQTEMDEIAKLTNQFLYMPPRSWTQEYGFYMLQQLRIVSIPAAFQDSATGTTIEG